MTNQQNCGCSSSTIDSDPCPICLGSFVQDSYLDRCFHKFCYNCIIRWTKVVAGKHSPTLSSVKCPLCKTENFSIVHGYDGHSFQKHYISQDSENRFFFSKAHKSRLQCYYTKPGLVDDEINVSRYWKLGKYLQPNQWLHSWLQREIQALMQEEDVYTVVHHILGVIESFGKSREQLKRAPEMRQKQFKALVADSARPFLAGRTEQFVDEVELFLASGLNLEAYDEVYTQKLGLTTPKMTANDEERDSHEHMRVAPYLHLFDDDSDETD